MSSSTNFSCSDDGDDGGVGLWFGIEVCDLIARYAGIAMVVVVLILSRILKREVVGGVGMLAMT